MENLYNCSDQQYYGTTCCTEFRNLETKGPEEVPIPVVELNILLLFSVEGQFLFVIVPFYYEPRISMSMHVVQSNDPIAIVFCFCGMYKEIPRGIFFTYCLQGTAISI